MKNGRSRALQTTPGLRPGVSDLLTFAEIMYRTPILLWFLLCIGCGPHIATPSEAASAADLIVLGEIRIESGEEKLIAVEVLKGRLGNEISFQIGGQITSTFGSVRKNAGSGNRVLLFYQKRFGSQSWFMTTTASGEFAPIVQELRKKANQASEPTAPSGRGSP